jgi:hypothetical protein
MMVNNWTKKAYGGVLVVWAFSGSAMAQNFGPGPGEEGFEEAESAALKDVDLEFSEDQRALLKELRAWLHQRNLERARAAAYRAGDMDDADRFDSGTIYRSVRPPQLLHDARNWQARPQPRLHIGRVPDERVRDNYYRFRDPKTIDAPRRQMAPNPVSERRTDIQHPSTLGETKAKRRVKLVWTTDLARHKPDSR